MNQKRRTRAALVTAAKELLQQGISPTVAQAAEAAEVGRTTAYRYFPTQDSLLIELSLTIDVDDIEELVAQPVDAGSAVDRVLEVAAEFNRHVFAEQVPYRTSQRLYHDQWLAATAGDEELPLLREGRRTRWIETALAPLAGSVPDADLGRLVHALCMVMGPEPMIVMQDVCHLDTDDALAVQDWAARALVRATFGEAAD